jgi:hypothetical protein
VPQVSHRIDRLEIAFGRDRDQPEHAGPRRRSRTETYLPFDAVNRPGFHGGSIPCRKDGAHALWMPCAAMVIGALRAAFDGCVELIADKVGSDPARTPYIDSGRMQQTLGGSAATIECLSAGLRTVAEDLWSAAQAGEAPSLRLRAIWWSTLLHVFDTARHTVSDLYRSSGSTVYGTRNPIERSMRDIHAIATTFEQPPVQALRADAGRVLAGKEPTVAIF